MYPLLMLIVFGITALLRRKLLTREMQEHLHEMRLFGLPWAFLLQPYTSFMLVFVVLYFYLFISFVTLCCRYSWLDPSTFIIMFPDDKAITKELEFNGLMRVLSLLSPVLIGATFVVTVMHLYRHLPRSRGFDDHLRWCPSYSHDLAMQVVALPLVYGIFGLDNVGLMLHIITGEGKHATKDEWQREKTSIQQDYDANFDIADLYEAWALRSFGLLCFVLVSRQIKLEVPTVQYLIEIVTQHLANIGGQDSRDFKVINELEILKNPQKLLFDPLRQTSGLGVDIFVVTYAFKSLYELTLQFLDYPPINIQLCGNNGVFPAACSMQPYLDGACLLASTLAITNIVLFERSMKDILERDKFKPFAKFLAVKVLVSIVFIQYYMLSVLMGQLYKNSEVQIKLCYACLVCWEAFPLSLLVYFAWRPTAGDWYAGDRFGNEDDVEIPSRRGQLAGESSFVAEDSSLFKSSRLPTEALNAGRAMSDEVAAVIELRGEIKANEGKALETVINTLSRTVRAHYKPAALFRGLGERRTYWSDNHSISGRDDSFSHAS